MSCNDFNNDGVLDIDDVQIYFAYTQILQRPVFLRPNPITVNDVQKEYDKLFPTGGATVVYIPELICVTPTPTPTPTPTHCYNHPDYVLNFTQNTFHCSIQGAVDNANDNDELQLTTGVDYEAPVMVSASSPKGLVLTGDSNLITGGSITVEDNTITIDNIHLSGSNLVLNNILSGTEINNCTFEESRVVANVVDELLLENNTFVRPCSTSTEWAISLHLSQPTSFAFVYNNTITIPVSGNGIHATSSTSGYCKIDDNILNNCETSVYLTRLDYTVENNLITSTSTGSGIVVDQPTPGTSGTIRQNVLKLDNNALTFNNITDKYRVDASYNYWQNYMGFHQSTRPDKVVVDTSPRYTNDSKTSLIN